MAKRTTKEKQDKPVEFSSELQRKIVEGKLAVDELYDALRTLSVFSELAAERSEQSGIKAGDTLGGTQILIACLAERAKVASEALWEPFLECNV